MLSSETGTAYAYYPYAEACTDITAISIRANSTVQTDFMWGIPVSVSKDNRKATLVMKHALAAVRITYVRGTYSGTGNVSKVSFGGNCIATAGTLDATDTLLRLLLPLNDKVQWTSHNVAGSGPPTSPQSEHFTGPFNR